MVEHMVELVSLFDTLYQEIVVAIALGTGAIVIGYLRKLYRLPKQNKKAIDELCKRSWRIERAFALFMQIAINENKKNHGDSTFDEVEDLVNLILKDNPESTS